MSKHLHLCKRPPTPGLPTKKAAEELNQLLSTTYILLEDEELGVMRLAASSDTQPQLHRLVKDFYEDTLFTPGECGALADECRQLPVSHAGTRAWLECLAALAAEAGRQGLHLFAFAD